MHWVFGFFCVLVGFILGVLVGGTCAVAKARDLQREAVDLRVVLLGLIRCLEMNHDWHAASLRARATLERTMWG